MEKTNNIAYELKHISPQLASAERKNPYAIPENYFESFAGLIVQKINEGAEPGYRFSRNNSYSVPEGYFSQLSEDILQKIHHLSYTESIDAELETIAPILNTISKKPVYTVPAGYFEKEAYKPARLQKEGKVISLGGYRKKTIRYLAAAMITGLAVLSVFLINDEKKPSQTQAYQPKTEMNVDNLSEKEIIDFLKTNSEPGDFTTTSNNGNLKDHEIKNTLKKMSDKEIQQFLNENTVPNGI